MRRYIATVVAALFIAVVPVAAKPPAPVYIPQGGPLTRDLTGADHDIIGLRELVTSGGARIGGSSNIVVAQGVSLLDDLNAPDSMAELFTGTADPRTLSPRSPASLYLRLNTAGDPELWFHAGYGPNGWMLVQLVAP